MFCFTLIERLYVLFLDRIKLLFYNQILHSNLRFYSDNSTETNYCTNVQDAFGVAGIC